MPSLFISDLHLCDLRPDRISVFESLLSGLHNNIDAFYILGDLFEFWHGDDDLTRNHQRIIQAIAGVTAQDIPVYFQRGNRDFLAGDDFSKRTGAIILPDYHVVELYGVKTLIMHGDLLCTGDIAYQTMRRIFNLSWLQWLFLQTPLNFRRSVSAWVRNYSKQENSTKSPDIMDVAQATVEQTLQEYGVSELIHGHTHRPAIHEFESAAGPCRRIVLGDWYETDSVLVYGNDQQVLMSVTEFLQTA